MKHCTTSRTKSWRFIYSVTMATLFVLSRSACRQQCRLIPGVMASTVSSMPLKRRKSKNAATRALAQTISQESLSHHSIVLVRTISNSTKPTNTTTTTSTNPTNDNKSLSTPRKNQPRALKLLRQGVGGLFSAIGFVSSSVVSLVTDTRTLQDRSRRPIQALRKFLKTSGVDLEIEKSLNRHLGVNLALLGRVHQSIPSIHLGRSQSSYSKELSPLFWEEARRYMRYATAVYGQAMIHAAEVDARGRLDAPGFVTADAVSSHIGVPAEDIACLDVDYDGDSHHLRHFVAIDHENQKVVLSIRGTFSLQEVIVDVAGFSKEFCGGEGHSEMVTMAERVWQVAGPTVSKLLHEHSDYELILTGHSLGAGTAVLLTVMLQSKLQPKNQPTLPTNQKLRCFAYAAPPVYTPLPLAPKAVQSTTNFIHQNDVVPFLSVHSVRHLFSCLRTVQDYAYNNKKTCMSRLERAKVVMGWPVPEPLIEAVQKVPSLEPKPGAPQLEIPAGRTIWLREREDGEYEYQQWDPKSLLQNSEIRVHQDMLVDHFPPRYEHALDHLVLDQD